MAFAPGPRPLPPGELETFNLFMDAHMHLTPSRSSVRPPDRASQLTKESATGCPAGHDGRWLELKSAGRDDSGDIHRSLG